MFPSKLKNRTTWIFDLDNTLYSSSTGIFNQIDVKMKEFISMKLKISGDDSFRLQKKYYKKYGTTLYGLMRNYNIDPDEFCNYVHNVNFNLLSKSKMLKDRLQSLPGEKIIYTNANYTYAEKVLNKLGIKEVFLDIFDIKKTDYVPKPMKRSLNQLIKKYKLDPGKTVYFEDLKKNLKYSSSIGFTTVHISNESTNELDTYIDFRFKTIINALDMIIKVLNIEEKNEH